MADASKSTNQTGQLTDKELEELYISFKKADTHHTGYISMDELEVVMKEMDPNVTEEDVKAVFVDCDKDASNTLSFQ